MNEKYNYTSDEIETEIDPDYCADYIREHAYILMNALDRIEQLEKKNEIMKKILVMFISNINHYGELRDFDLKNKEVLEKLLGQLIL